MDGEGEALDIILPWLGFSQSSLAILYWFSILGEESRKSIHLYYYSPRAEPNHRHHHHHHHYLLSITIYHSDAELGVPRRPIQLPRELSAVKFNQNAPRTRRGEYQKRRRETRTIKSIDMERRRIQIKDGFQERMQCTQKRIVQCSVGGDGSQRIHFPGGSD